MATGQTATPRRDQPTRRSEVGVEIGGADVGRLLGTNVPAWLGPERLSTAWFRDAIEDSGTTTLRMPGGSCSNEYDWLARELGDADKCLWIGAVRPSDFAALLVETGLTGVWTVSVNQNEGFAVWGWAGSELLEASVEGDLGQVRVYPTRHSEGAC